MERLIDWDVEVIFGLPGDGINGIMEALRTREDPLYPSETRTIRSLYGLRPCEIHWPPGVCLATSGPGGIHLLNGLYSREIFKHRRFDTRPRVLVIAAE
jgi:pyruvate dehydrogenase (quinone)